ncbi:uncharacterized protein LOC117318403 isoform X1 [Pecten maximus]|uniref:uncharacterized protein LOC117318403 isoform X1 n=1 Tax=Pecten maximus TaxID=6579 RepID=UPI001457F78D|nr:uncharacterized protein LOC117318403 isoform X1 [Pecten maximus]
MTDGKKTYYHHTTKDGAAQILQSGYIKQSTDTKTDAAYGPGTYLTRMGPDKSQSDIAKNNYDGLNNQFADKMLRDGKTDVTIAIDLPSTKVTKAESDRDIYVSPGDVTIEDKNPRVYVRGDDGKAQEFKPKRK